MRNLTHSNFTEQCLILVGQFVINIAYENTKVIKIYLHGISMKKHVYLLFAVCDNKNYQITLKPRLLVVMTAEILYKNGEIPDTSCYISHITPRRMQLNGVHIYKKKKGF